MIKVGIIGNFIKISNMLLKIYSVKGYKVKITDYKSYKNDGNSDVIIIDISYKDVLSINLLKLNILIVEKINLFNAFKNPVVLEKSGILLINADNRNDLKLLDINNSCIITYGFNNKSTITLSSIDLNVYNSLQICIQRSIFTISKKIIEEQEFSVNIKDNDIMIILLSITIALINDFEVNDIKEKII